MKPLLIYAAVTILLAAVDAIRIRLSWGKKKNIDHRISWGLAIAAGITQYLITKPPYHNSLFWGLFWFAYMCVSVRLLIYDVFLDLFRWRKIGYTSSTTSSWIDRHFTWLTFWHRRFIAAWMVVFAFISYYNMFGT
jgi:hypothetical protein